MMSTRTSWWVVVRTTANPPSGVTTTDWLPPSIGAAALAVRSLASRMISPLLVPTTTRPPSGVTTTDWVDPSNGADALAE